MRICIVTEGCYPYVVGGVSGWTHSMIRAFPDYEFVVVAILANRESRGKFVYELPDNVSEVHEVYLNDIDWGGERHVRRARLHYEEYRALRSLMLDEDVDWDTVFALFQSPGLSLNDLLMGEDFLRATIDCYEHNYSQINFSDYLWSMRSIYLPLFLVLRAQLPKADLYHCVATGYAGVLGAMAKHRHGCGLLVSEHGIYTREREEELIKAKWVQGVYKDIWIDQFKKLSKLAYDRADTVTGLYEHARSLQIELGCPKEKTMVIPNGIDIGRLEGLPGKSEEETDRFNLGAVLRVAPIKDVKTMIQAFSFAKQKNPRMTLWIMGPEEEEPEYAQECRDLVEALKVEDVIFTGRVDVREYLGRMDALILTSVSEGQPLTILEGFAARKPSIATDVGNCRGLLLGEYDDYGAAGILTHIMNVQEIANAIVTLSQNETTRRDMGEIGYRRVCARYRLDEMRTAYAKLYEEFREKYADKQNT